MAEKNEDLRGKNLGVFICWLLGIGCLMGFNSMMIIEDYYISLFPKYHPTRLITISYQPLVLVTTAIYTYYEAKVNTRVRILAGYMTAFLCTFAMIAVNTMLVLVDVASSGSGGIAAFVVICVIAGGFGVADGHVQAGLTGDLSLMCQEFLQSFFAGQAAAGAVTSVLRFITKGAFESTHNGLRKGAMLFCSIACFFVLTCVLLYAFVFPKLPIVKFYRSKAALEGSLTVTADLAAGGVQGHHNSMPDEDPTLPERMSGKQLLLRNADYALDVFLIYALSLAIVPGFVAEDTGSHSLGSWYALVLMASFNVLDLIGRYIPLIEYIKLTSRKGLVIASVLRFLFVPAFYYTVRYGDQGWMIMLTSLLGLSNGYLTVCVLTEAPKGFKGPEQNALGNILVFFLLAGLFAGAMLGWLWLIGKGPPKRANKHDKRQRGSQRAGYSGNGCLFGFNSMLTIEDYFTYLFPNYHPTRVITLTYQPFVLTISGIFAYHEAKVNTRLRNLVGYMMFFLSSLALVTLDLAISGRGGIAAFIGVCTIVAVFGIAEGHVEGAMTGDLSLMCPEFIQSFSAGMAASGAITSALRLVTKASFENSREGLRKGAMLFFSISCFFQLLCFLLYAYVFPKLPIVKFYRSKAASEGSLTVTADLAAGGIEMHPNRWDELSHALGERLNNKQLLVQNKDYALDVFLIYMLTLSVFPGFLAEDVGSHSLGSWYPLVLIATYNAWDLIGRYLPLIKHIKLTSRKGLLVAVLSQFVLLPAFYYAAKCRAEGWMIVLASVLGLSNGYLTVCVFTEAPKGYKVSSMEG
ncbi:hypothetical protein EJB05_11808 [Eragrostis curvula]|uniref:Uncharacterized protein n=1 Tax=Eragrostis curvula TaxID=38414 RepID=A0A5J9VSB2_9POAL|nr:hypothetical protein EJB05_11808 [Eragrostis curvula]